MASKCRKFVPNIFNKLKCQTCFGSKEQHSAEALENNKASRKVSKCGYLFVAPGYDFSNPLDKTRRWQRRFFVLYDDGELAYSVDENPDTVPQGVVDMNKCTDVKDASGSTSHENSLAVITPEKTTYIKANSKEEIQWWESILVKYAEENIKLTNNNRNFKTQYQPDNKENYDSLNLIENSQPKTVEFSEKSQQKTAELSDKSHSKTDAYSEKSQSKKVDLSDTLPPKTVKSYENSRSRSAEFSEKVSLKKEDLSENSINKTIGSNEGNTPKSPMLMRKSATFSGNTRPKSVTFSENTPENTPPKTVTFSETSPPKTVTFSDDSPLKTVTFSEDSPPKTVTFFLEPEVLSETEEDKPKSESPAETSKDHDDSATTNGVLDVDKVKPKDQAFTTYRGVRSMKHNKENKHYQEGLRKSSSLHDLSTEERESGSLDNSRFLSRSGDRLDTEDPAGFSDSARLLSGYSNNPYLSIPRTQSWKNPSSKSLQSSSKNQASSSNSSIVSNPSTSSEKSAASQRRGSFDDKTGKSRNASERARLHRERSASMKSFPTGLTLPKIASSVGSSSVDRLLPRRDSGGHENETDEHKMAKSSELQTVSRSTPPPPSPTARQSSGASAATKFESSSALDHPAHVRISLENPDRDQEPSPIDYEDLMYMKKGWLIKMGTSEKDWKKHWFVLTGNSLRYYKDAKAEESSMLDGRIDLSSCYEIAEAQIQRNYGFKIKTQNGEYILSAMTSGIRSNWMKAIRLCMDLQNSNKARDQKQTDLSSLSSGRTNDDMDIETSSTSSRASEKGRLSGEKKDFSRKNRRHYSDVNPGNISKMFSIQGLTLDKSLSQSVSSQSSAGSSAASSKEPSAERETHPELSLPSHMDLAAPSAPKPGRYEQFAWSADHSHNIPFKRFVEGSDSHVTSSTSSVDQSNKPADDKLDEEERKRRAKSPSTKVKERTRAKSPRMHSPPPGLDGKPKFSYTTVSAHEEDKMSLGSSEDISYIDDHDDVDGDDNLPSSAGEGMLVDLLENEVEQLKERLEHTQQELSKSHDSNRDLKTKLQTVVREKDPAQLQANIDHNYSAALSQPPSTGQDLQQLNTMKRQLKEAKDAVVRQKTEIDQLKSKLDMSNSKLAGTEKALSEALKDVKQEKDKFLKVSTEYNKKVRNLENQLREVTQKMEKYHENSLIKDKENRKLDLELKQNQQQLRDHEREILKLKAVEHEYRQSKEKLDETEKIATRMRMDMKEKDEQMKKMENAYEEQYESLMQDFSKERDATEQHIEELKEQLMRAQEKSSMSDHVSNDVADMLREKDEIIAQLEEKVIENETKLVEISEEIKADEEENTELHQNIEMLQSERDSSLTKIKDLEKSLTHYQTQVQRMEKENQSIRKHMDDLRKENTDLCERLDHEKSDVSNLAEDNDSLKHNVKELEVEVHSLHERLNEVVAGHEKSTFSNESSNSQDMLHTFILASAEINDVNDNMANMRKKFESILANVQGDQKAHLTQVAELIEDLGQKCENISDILKEGATIEGEQVTKETLTKVESSKGGSDELDKLRKKNKDLQEETDKWKKQVADANNKCKQLKSEEEKRKDELDKLDVKYCSEIESLHKRVEDLSTKQKVPLEKSTPKSTANRKPKRGSKDPVTLSAEVQEQLHELELKVEMVEKVLQSHDLSVSSVEDSQNESEEDESDTETEDSDAEYSDTETESEDDESDGDSTVAEEADTLLGKLKQMKRQLVDTNTMVKELTSDLEVPAMSTGSTAASTELKQTLMQCSEHVESLTERFTEGLKTARTEMPRFSDNTWAFQKCLSKLKNKVTEVTILVNEHDDLNAKDLKTVKAKVSYLAEFVAQFEKLGESDWDIAGKIAKQELKFQHLLAHKEKATKKSSLKYEDRLQLYADKLAFEAMILGQMGILIQRQQIGAIYKDSLLREIHESNLQILELERRIDSVSSEMNQSDQERDLVSSYAAVLAEKIVLEGQLASGAMVQDVESSENMEVLAALQVDESPAVLAMEIFLRSQVDTSVTAQLTKFSETMDSVSNHVVTRALLQGEITHALQLVKKKFKKSDQSEDLSTLVKRERKFAFDELQSRHKLILDLVNETEPMVMTTLIQLIEFSQGPNSPTLNSVCDKISGVVQERVDEYEKLIESADSESKSKYKHIIEHLHSERSDAISIFREEHQCYVQTASPDINPNVLKYSADSLAADLAGMFIQKAIIDGTFTYVEALYEALPEVSVSQMMEPMSHGTDTLSDLAKCLGQILLTEAANKQKIAVEVRSVTSSSGEGAGKGIADLVGVIPDLEAYPQSFEAYASTLVREAMFQSQLTYTTYKLKLQYHRELRDIKLKFEAGEAVVLPTEISREAESDIQASMTIFEEILNTKFQDECAVLNQLEAEINNLKTVPNDKSCSKCKTFESNLKTLEKTFQHEVSVAKERQNVHIDVLRQEVHNIILRVDRFLEDHEKEREAVVADYEDRICTLQDEFDFMKVDHEEELEQVKQDIMTAVSAIRATEAEDLDTVSNDQIRHHNKQLMNMCSRSKELLAEIKNNLGSDQADALTEKIETQMSQIMTLETDPTYTLEVSVPPVEPLLPGSPNFPLELPVLDRSLSADRSEEHVDKLLERSQHEHEMEQLKKEKEAALAEEVRTTKAALDAMRKAYEEELETEKEKYRHALKTMFTDNYVEDIRRRNDLESEKLREELRQATMHYESKCEDYKLMEDRLARTKTEYQTHINQLVRSNEHLTELVNTEIEQLKEFIQTRSKGQLTGSSTLDEELYDTQIMVRVKDAELQKLRTQVKNLENSLERTTEEQRYTMTQYLQCLKKNQEIQAKLRDGTFTNRERKDSSTREEEALKAARAVRRNPSFHQRARSPSPVTTSPRKDNNNMSREHTSRDSHRRSRGGLSAKDLKRSKSTPSLPFVFEAPANSGAPSRRSDGVPSGRRDQNKYISKPGKK